MNCSATTATPISEFGVPWGYLAAVHLVETRMGRIRGESSAGAQGPMQFLPSTWAAYGEGDINSNKDSIRAAARYLKRNGAPGDMRNALWNYNHSFLYVDAVTEYAKQMLAAERAFFGYHHWQVYYRTTNGDVLLPVGYGARRVRRSARSRARRRRCRAGAGGRCGSPARAVPPSARASRYMRGMANSTGNVSIGKPIAW